MHDNWEDELFNYAGVLSALGLAAILIINFFR